MSDDRTHVGAARVKKATKFQVRPRRSRWSFAIGAIWALAAMLSVVNAIWLYQRSSDDAQTANAGSDMGRIVQQTDNEQCALGNFDNDTGRIIESAQHCETIVKLDAHGVPLPEGTIHRLDAIRDSFSRDDH